MWRRENILFTDRSGAGRQLAERMLAMKETNPVVLAFPRGGVPVVFETACALAAPLDLVLVRKIGARSRKSSRSAQSLMARIRNSLPIPGWSPTWGIALAYLQEAKSAALREFARRRRVYLGDRQPVVLAGRTAIIVDDGIARMPAHGTHFRNPSWSPTVADKVQCQAFSRFVSNPELACPSAAWGRRRFRVRARAVARGRDTFGQRLATEGGAAENTPGKDHSIDVGPNEDLAAFE
jgi:hypothetical protein